jgi:hypothetical protein
MAGLNEFTDPLPLSEGLSQTVSPWAAAVPRVAAVPRPLGIPASWKVVTLPQFVPGQCGPTVPVTAKVPFPLPPVQVNPARVTSAPTFKVMLDTVKVPVVPDTLAAVTVSAVFEGGLVPAKQDLLCSPSTPQREACTAGKRADYW